jgi:hypothetical protein
MSPLGLTADTDLSLLLALTDVPVDPGHCPTCITGHLTRPDLLWGDHATAAPFQVCEDCGVELPDLDPEF